MYFRNYGLRNTWLINCLERLVSEDLSSDNMINGSKKCFNLNSIRFGIFINQCEGN